MKTTIIITILSFGLSVWSFAASATDPLLGTGAQPESYFYTGKPYDEDLECYVFYARNYSPSANRWLSQDPSGYPDGANNQIYPNNPLNTCDPTGFYSLSFSNQKWIASFTLAIYDSGNGTGAWIDNATAQGWKNAIIHTWAYTGTDKTNGQNLSFQINITSFGYFSYTSGATLTQLRNNFDFVAQVAAPEYRSNVYDGNQVFWSANASALVIAHEAGHLMRARDFYTDANGAAPGWENSLMGAAKPPITKDWNEVFGRNGKTSHLFGELAG